MKAFIIFKGSDKCHCGPGLYALVTENSEEIAIHWSSSRSFANHDLTQMRSKMLEENGITEVYSNGYSVWADKKMTTEADAAFRAANCKYERENSDAI